MVKQYGEFLFEWKKLKKLSYPIFDWDDNILKMHTLLHFKKNINGKWVDVDITPEEFANIRKKYPADYMDNAEWKGDLDYSFIEFRDFGPREEKAFIEDVKTSIKMGNFGPSWEPFLETLISGKLFAIVTTRGHEPPTLRNAVEYIINNILNEEQKGKMIKNIKKYNKVFKIKPSEIINDYLDKCYFIGLFSKAFEEQFKFAPHGKLLNKGKQVAIEYFVNYVRDYSKELKLPMKIGFSDDDKRFSGAAKDLFMGMEKSLDFMETFYVFDTSDPKLKRGVRSRI